MNACFPPICSTDCIGAIYYNRSLLLFISYFHERIQVLSIFVFQAQHLFLWVNIVVRSIPSQYINLPQYLAILFLHFWIHFRAVDCGIVQLPNAPAGHTASRSLLSLLCYAFTPIDGLQSDMAYICLGIWVEEMIVIRWAVQHTHTHTCMHSKLLKSWNFVSY